MTDTNRTLLPPVDALTLAGAAASLTKFVYGDVPQRWYHEATFEWVAATWIVGPLTVAASSRLYPDGTWTV